MWHRYSAGPWDVEKRGSSGAIGRDVALLKYVRGARDDRKVSVHARFPPLVYLFFFLNAVARDLGALRALLTFSCVNCAKEIVTWN